MKDRFAHVAAVVAGVVATAARDARRSRLVIVESSAPETGLLERILTAARVGLPVERGSAQAERSAALRLDPVNKTVAVLFPELLTEPVLPLADLYASHVQALAGDWGAPDDARELIERTGGIGVVDAFLTRHLEERHPLDLALAGVPDPGARRLLRDRFEAGWWWRRRVGVVPKLGARTLGIDLR